MRLTALFLTFPSLLAAQLIPAGQPVPKGPNPPVVFVNGYQSPCGGSFADSFYAADKLLQANSIVTLFFDNCSIGGEGAARPSIEAEGIAFGKFLAALKYTDGTPVTQVDVVAHSVGGLMVRSYLAGKQEGTPAVFIPPATVPIRKAVFIATPNFGTPIAGLLGSSADMQLVEMTPGSQFLFDLNSWNQGNDDLRGIEAIAIAGNGGAQFGPGGFDDGVVALTSASLGFYKRGVTRAVPDCHITYALLQLVGYCSASTPAIANINTDPNNLVSNILVSFLTGTNAWKSLGTAAEDLPNLSGTAGVMLQLRDANDMMLPAIGATLPAAGGPPVTTTANSSSGIVANERVAAAKVAMTVTPLSGAVQNVSVDLTSSATTEAPVVVKTGPVISPTGVVIAAGPAQFPRDVAPGAYVSIYGTNLASSINQAGIPYPPQIDDVQVLVDDVPQQLVFVSPGQINFVYANSAAGLTKLKVKNSTGQNTANIRVAPAVPSIFLLDSGRAAALNALTSVVVGPNAPLHVKDFLSIYLTGLGDAVKFPPVVTIGGQNIPTLYAGLTPGYAGLNQINVQIPAGIATGAAVPVIVTSNGRSSNVATIAIQ
ncbi:MAG: hypothetical protein ABJC09_05155 [Terriglobia bacterium]